MESEHEETSVALGISIPIDSSKNLELLKEDHSAAKKLSDALIEQLKFSNLIHSLDPNLGILEQLPPSNIIHEKSTLNPWNIEPHFLNVLPLSSSNENSILLFGGLNLSSVSNKIPPDFDNDDFVLGSTIFQYTLDSGIWKYYGTMIEPRCYHACALDGQYLYITGGYSLLKRKHGEMIAISSTDRLNLMDRHWKSCTNMILSRAAHALVSHKGYLYAFGGRNSQGSILASVEMYDPHEDLWIEITSLPHPTMGLSATCIMDSIWLIGGITDHPSKDPAKCLLSSVFSFIPSEKKLSEEVSLPYACAFSSCIYNDYALWLIGGCTASRNSQEENTMMSCSSVLRFSLSEKHKWKSVASLLYPRHALTAVLQDECIYVFGGVESCSKCACDKVEVINTIGNVSTICTKMPVPIAGCSSILVFPARVDYRFPEEESDFSTFSEKSNFKTGEDSHYFYGSTKTSSTLVDDYNENRNSYLSLISPTKEFHVENYKETFSEKSEIPIVQSEKNVPIEESEIVQESFEKKDVLHSEVKKLKVESDTNFRYRTSMEIFLDFDEIGPYGIKKEPSQASKWLEYLQNLSLSDEKIHKDVFHSKIPKLNVKTEMGDIDEGKSIKSTEVKYFEEDKKLDLPTSKCVQSALSSQNKSFVYVKSSIKNQHAGINLEKDFKKKRKEISKDNNILKAMDLKLDNSYNDVLGEAKLTIKEDSFPIILLIGGEYSKRPVESRFILTYYCNEDVWESAGCMLPEYRIYHSTVFFNNKIYVIGGFNSENSKFNENITNKTMYYDIYEKLWYDVANINCPRAHHSAVVLKDNIYILGGRDQSGKILSSVEAYDESNGVWKECKPLPYPILGAAAFSLDDSIHIFGGITYENDTDEIVSSASAIFDVKKNNWIIGFELPMPLAFCGVANHLNSVCLFGGLTIEENELISSKYIFQSDVFTKTWAKVAELSTPRFASVTVSIEEKVYVIGGHSTQEKREVLMCELIDLDKNEVSLLKSLPIGISGKSGIAIT